MQLQIAAAAIWRMQTKSNSAIDQITLLLVIIVIIFIIINLFVVVVQLEVQPWYYDSADKYDCEQKVRAVGQVRAAQTNKYIFIRHKSSPKQSKYSWKRQTEEWEDRWQIHNTYIMHTGTEIKAEQALYKMHKIKHIHADDRTIMYANYSREPHIPRA